MISYSLSYFFHIFVKYQLSGLGDWAVVEEDQEDSSLTSRVRFPIWSSYKGMVRRVDISGCLN